ncbi:MAG: LEA type 2 family protein, partial [Meiothermus silvanus]|nr:LEA type 2 family protein [Allomeiothermus silvanus]
MKRFVLFLSLVLLAGCVPQQARPQPPQVELVSFSLVSLDPFTGFADLDVRLRLTNPNSFTLPLLDSTLSAELAGAGFSMTLPALELPSNTPRETQTRLRVPIAQGVQALASLVSGRPTRFRLQGEMQARVGPVNVPIGPFTLVDRDVTVNLNFTPPTLRLVEIRFENGTFKLVLETQNPNPIGFN